MDPTAHPNLLRHGYSVPARLLHWCTALAVFGLLALGLWMTGLPADTEADISRIFRTYSIHKTIGVAVLALGLVRLLRAIAAPAPGPLHPERQVEAFAARTTHWTLRIGLVALPLTGLAHHAAAPGFAPILWPFGQHVPGIPDDEALALAFRAAHRAAGWLLMGAIALHLLGTAKHVLLDRDATLSRMTTGAGPVADPDRRAAFAVTAAFSLWAAVLTTAIATAPAPETSLPLDDGTIESFGDIVPPDVIAPAD